jgi:hypothetical protein
VPPERAKLDKALSWYDNQCVLEKIFGGWKGIRIGGWRFAGRCGHEVRRSYDKALTSRDSDPTLPNGSKTVRGAYSTRAYARVNGGVKARNLGGKPIEINAFGQQCEFPQEDYFGQGMNSLGQPHQLPPRRRRNRCLSALEALQAGLRRWCFLSQSACRTGDG